MFGNFDTIKNAAKIMILTALGMGVIFFLIYF